MVTKSSEFLSCPFCGSQDISTYRPEEDYGQVCYCVDCGAEARNEANRYMNEKEALAHWNRRPNSDRLMEQTIHVNDIVEIKPTDDGWIEIREYVDRINVKILNNNPMTSSRISVPRRYNDGYIKGQFWLIMQMFDWTTGVGSKVPFTGLRLFVAEDVRTDQHKNTEETGQR